MSGEEWPVGTWLYEEATRHVRPADPTDPGDAADLSISMGYSVSLEAAPGVLLPAEATQAHPAAQFQLMVQKWLRADTVG